jgi:O-antigen/teichoic acid export membrane protein
MRIGQTSFVVFISKLGGSAIGFLATIYFARVLGAEILGYFALALALVTWLTVPSGAGVVSMGAAMKKRMSEGEDSAEYLTASLIIVGTIGLAVVGTVIVLGDYVNAYVGRPVASFVAGLLAVQLISEFTRDILSGERKVHISGLLTPVKISGQSLAKLALVVVGFELTGLLIGHAVGGLLVGIAGMYFVSTGVAQPQREHFESLFEYARFSWLSGLKNKSFDDVDVLVLGVFVPSALVGIYSVAWSIATFLTLFDTAVSSAVFPELSKADSENSRNVVSKLINDSLTYGGLIVIPGFFGSLILGERLLRVYGPEFTQGATVLWVLVLSSLLYGYQKQLMNALNAVDRPDIAFRINLSFIAANVVLNVILIYAFGYIGAAIATAMSAGFGLLLSFFALRSLLSFSIPLGEVARQLLAAGLMSGAVIAGLWAFEAIEFGYNIIVLLTLVSSGASIYFLALYGLSTEFRSTVVANSPVRIPQKLR